MWGWAEQADVSLQIRTWLAMSVMAILGIVVQLAKWVRKRDGVSYIENGAGNATLL